jgi:hypothetical protein
MEARREKNFGFYFLPEKKITLRPLTCKTRAHNKQKENLGAHEEK